MAPGCIAEKGKHKSGACKTCNSGVCHDCCNCRQRTRGRPRKQQSANKTLCHSARTMSAGIVAESVVPCSICTVHPDAPAAADIHPTAFHPTAVHPTAVHPTAVHPTAVHPTAVHPTAVHPTAVHPTAVHPTAVHPTAVHPTAVHPTAVHPTAVHPTAVHPTAVHPTAVPSYHADYGCRDHIFQILSLLGTQANSDVNHLPSANDRKVARVKEDLTEDGFRRVKSVFWKGVKGWIKILLPSWNLPDDKVFKKLFCLPSGPFDDKDEADASDTEGIGIYDDHTLVTNNIIQAIKQEKSLHTLNARHLLAPLGTLSTLFWCKHLNLKETCVGELKFQANVDNDYHIRGLPLQQYPKSRRRIEDDVVKNLVDFIYSDDNVTRLAWVATKQAFRNDQRWSELEHVAAMKSLVLKRDLATMYHIYRETMQVQGDNQKIVGISLFRNIVQNITGGGKKQAARAGVDYIKINFHTDNFALLDMAIKALLPSTEASCALRDELHYQRNLVYDFLSYGYSQHVREGVKARYESSEAVAVEHFDCHLSLQEQEQFHLYNEIHSMTLSPDDFDITETQQAFVQCVKTQLDACTEILGRAGTGASLLHSPKYTLDLAEDHAPRVDPKRIGYLDCTACRGPYLFFDSLRRIAFARFENQEIDLTLLSDVLLTIHQCERRTFRYMAHVVQDVQQHYLMHLVRKSLGGDTMYVTFDFKQKFLSKGFREGGDAYYGKKGILWFGAAAYVKQQCSSGSGDSYIGNRNNWNTGNDCTNTDEHLADILETFEDGQDEDFSAELSEAEEIISEDTTDEEDATDEEELEEYEDDEEEDNQDAEGYASEEEIVSEIDEMNVVDNGSILHFVDSIVEGDEKADSSVTLSCLEASFHVLRQRFPYVRKVILQSDNAKTFGGNVTTQLLPIVARAAGLECIGYYHNEAAAGKDVCDTHFSHQQARVDAYIAEGSGGRKVSTAKQLAAALSYKLVKNTTVLLLKPDFMAPFQSSNLKTIPGIASFYATQYITTSTVVDGIEKHGTSANFFMNLGQCIPSKTVTLLPTIAPASVDLNPFHQAGANFTGVHICMNSDLDQDRAVLSKTQRRYKRKKSNRRSIAEERLKKSEEEAAVKLSEINAIYPQCSKCKYHFKSDFFLRKHICGGAFQPKDALNVAMRFADTILATRDFSVSGCVASMLTLFTSEGSPTYATFECNFKVGWAQTRKAMHPVFSSKVHNFIAHCWQEGIAGRAKVSADAVVVRLTDEYLAGNIRLAELPVVGQLRTSYQSIGQSKDEASKSQRKKRGCDEPQRKKQKTSHTTFDWSKPLLKWSKPQLQTYLAEHNLHTSGNKPELIERVQECMNTNSK